MKSLKIAALFAVLLISTAYTQAANWKFDVVHSSVQFEVSHLVIATATGNFKTFDGEVIADKDDFQDAKINFTIDVKSINTENQKRDDHLRSADFFDADNHPKMTFKSTSFKKVKGNKYKLTGNLTMRGVTKNITLEVTYNGMIKDPWGNTKAGFKIKGSLNRFDFGLKWDKTIEAGGLVVGKDIDIVCNIELQKEKAL